MSFDDEVETTNAGNKSTGLLSEFKIGHATCRGNKERTSRGWKRSFIKQVAYVNRSDKIIKNDKRKEQHEGDNNIFGVEGRSICEINLVFKCSSNKKVLKEEKRETERISSREEICFLESNASDFFIQNEITYLPFYCNFSVNRIWVKNVINLITARKVFLQ